MEAKTMYKPNIAAFAGTFIACMLGVCALLLCSCGKKADPFIPMQAAPKDAKSVRAIARPESVVVLWKAPKRNTNDTPLLDLSGFLLFRAEDPFEKACPGCPKDFRQLYDYDYTGPLGKEPARTWMVYYDRDVRYQTLYTYKIHCYNENEVMSIPSEVVHIYYDVPPEPPAAITAERKYRLVRLEWNKPQCCEDGAALDAVAGYTVYRTTRRGEYDRFPLNDDLLQTTFFEDIPDKEEEAYFYTVRTVRKVRDTFIESAPSEEVAVPYMDIIPPSIPQGLAAIPRKEGILLKWVPKIEKDFAGFNLYRRETGQETFIKLNKKLITKSAWMDSTAHIGTTYIYAVTSVDTSLKGNESDLSETVTVLYILQ